MAAAELLWPTGSPTRDRRVRRLRRLAEEPGRRCRPAAAGRVRHHGFALPDAAIPTDNGVILCSMGKADRRTEPAAIAALLRTIDVPIAGTISGIGRIEGGDVTWLDRKTLAVGRGYRTNDEGIRQL